MAITFIHGPYLVSFRWRLNQNLGVRVSLGLVDFGDSSSEEQALSSPATVEMVSLLTSSSDSSGNSGYWSNVDSRNRLCPELRDPVWDWAIKVEHELQELRSSYAEVKAMEDYLSECDIKQTYELGLAAEENQALKKRLKRHQLMTVVSILLMVVGAPFLAWLLK